MSNELLWAWIGLAIVIMPVQFIVAAPYGRHVSHKWGPEINNKLGWIIMEVVSLGAFSYFFFAGDGVTPVALGIATLYILHYIHRSLIYPLMLRTGSKKMPIAIVLFAILFNVVNGSINGDYLSSHPSQYSIEYLSRPNFVIGGIVFLLGAAINLRSDYKLLSLRANTPHQVHISSHVEVCLTGSPARIILVRFWSGRALPSFAGVCQPWLSLYGLPLI